MLGFVEIRNFLSEILTAKREYNYLTRKLYRILQEYFNSKFQHHIENIDNNSGGLLKNTKGQQCVNLRSKRQMENGLVLTRRKRHYFHHISHITANIVRMILKEEISEAW